MIRETVTHRCRNCQSENIVKNGRNACGKQQYRCNRTMEQYLATTDWADDPENALFFQKVRLA